MALIQYIGKDPVVVDLYGERKLIKPNKIFTGPEHFKNFDNFKVLGYTAEEKVKIETGNRKGLHLEIKKEFNPFINFEFLEETDIPYVSICIVTKNGNGIIQRCIDSIYQFTKYPSFEILICDTGTSDQTVLNYYQELRLKGVKIFQDSYNFSRNNNLLAKKASGNVLLFLNNDVFLTYDAISEMVKYILCSNIGCLGHRLVWDHDKTLIQHDGQILFNNSGQWIGPGHHNLKQSINSVPNTNVRVEGVTAACLMIRKSLFDQVNGFDEGYFDIYQDVDLNLKIRKLGYENFCIRKKSLIHVDHGTRKVDITPDSYKDAEKYKRDWISKGNFPVLVKKNYSILVCATNRVQLEKLKDSIKSREEFELVYINNRSNYFWSSEALNILTDVSEGEIVLWMHQDVTFNVCEPLAGISETINELGGKFGIIGPAGIQVGQKGGIRGVDFSSLKYAFNYMRVQTLDEFCLIGRRSNNLRFNESLDHFHFYGADICLQSLEKGLTNYVIKIPITHHSGGDVNLKKRGGYEEYQRQGKKFYKQWFKKYPRISTTTVHFKDTKVEWYLGRMLGLVPNSEMIDFSNIDESVNIKHYLTKTDYLIERYFTGMEEGVSIIILNKDKPEYIKECVNNIKKYLEGCQYEIIIGDTGSTNQEVLEFYKDLNVKFLDSYHFSKNNNELAKLAKYNKLLFMNNDVFINCNVLEKMRKLLIQNVAIVGLKLLYPDGKIQHAGVEMVISKERNPKEYYLPEHIDYKKDNFDKSNELVDCVTGACLMIPTKLFLEYEGFDEQFDKVFQDVDICLRIKKLGFKIMNCNEVWATHIESGTRNPEINTHDYNILVERWGSEKY